MKRRSLLRRRVLRSHGNDGGELVDSVWESRGGCGVHHKSYFTLRS